MQSEIPKIPYKKEEKLGIEVMSFAQLFDKLKQSTNHNPFAFHKIEFYLILILTKNNCAHFVDFEAHKLEEGGAIFIAENQVHHFTKEIFNTDGIAIIFNNSYFDKSDFLSSSYNFYRLFNYHIEKPTIPHKEIDKENIIPIAGRMLEEYTFPNSMTKSEILYSLLKVLLLKAERAKEIKAITGINNKWLDIFTNFKRLVEKEYSQTRSSRDYASKLLISYKLLNEVVKKLTGKTAKVFIDDFVTMEIKRYLTSTPLSIKEISFITGFEEAANLTNFFKKNTNTTPLKFRQQF